MEQFISVIWNRFFFHALVPLMWLYHNFAFSVWSRWSTKTVFAILHQLSMKIISYEISSLFRLHICQIFICSTINVTTTFIKTSMYSYIHSYAYQVMKYKLGMENCSVWVSWIARWHVNSFSPHMKKVSKLKHFAWYEDRFHLRYWL